MVDKSITSFVRSLASLSLVGPSLAKLPVVVDV